MSLRVAAALALLVTVADSLPIVDPGLFVIMGVRTCGEGNGYCLLGTDCTLDDDFVADTLGGHCDGLRNAFTPSAPFICCRYNAKPSNVSTTPRSRPKPTGAGTISTTTLAEASTTIEASSTTVNLTSSTTQPSDAEQDWSPIPGPFPVFGQDVKEVELDVSIPVGHRPVGSTTKAGIVDALDTADIPDLTSSSVSADSSGFADAAGLEASLGPEVSSVLVNPDTGVILDIGNGSVDDPATRERWLLGRLRKRQEIKRGEVAE